MASSTGTLLAYEDGKLVAMASGHFGAHDVAEAPDGTIWVATKHGLNRYDERTDSFARFESKGGAGDLADRIKIRCRFVEYDENWIAIKCPCQTNSLPLAT